MTKTRWQPDESLATHEIQRLLQTAVRAAIREQITSVKPSTPATTSGSLKRVSISIIRVASGILGVTAVVLAALASSLATPLLLLLLLLFLHRQATNMAKELRHETLFGTVNDGTTASNSAAEFRNDSSAIIHIRKIGYAHGYFTAGLDEDGSVEISKSPTLAGLTNNGPFYSYLQRLAAAAGVAADSSRSFNGGQTFGKGQLTLEPNESLFVNVIKDTGGALGFTYQIAYEFT